MYPIWQVQCDALHLSLCIQNSKQHKTKVNLVQESLSELNKQRILNIKKHSAKNNNLTVTFNTST